MAGPTKAGTLLDAVTVTGRASIRLPLLPSMTLFFISIDGGTATVAIEISDDEVFFIPVLSITESSVVQFAIPAAMVAANVTAVAGATVTVTYRTVVLENIPTDTLLVYNTTGTVRRPVTLPPQTVISAEAAILLKLAQTQIAVTPTIVYTVPADTQARIEQLILVNPTGVDRIVSLWHDGSTDPFIILPPTTIVAGGFATFNGAINMEPTDTLVADADAATAVTLTAYGYEQPVPA
jgi:hypothetical protein